MGEKLENTGRDQGGRFQKGASGNVASKPKGARHKASMLAERIFSGDIGAISKKVVREAKNGQSWACKLVVERVLPPARDRPVTLKLPAINSAADLTAIATSVLGRVADGSVTPQEGQALISVVDGLRRVFETVDLQAKLIEMDARLETVNRLLDAKERAG